MSTDAKTLYGILLDRMGLSVKNGWLDEQGRVYIIFPVQEVMDALGCADNKATKLFRELEKFGLIERKRRGLGKPNLIYVKNFADPRFRNREKNGPGATDSAQPEAAKSRGNKTEWNKTEGSEPDPFSSDAEDEPDERTRLEAYFMQSLEVDLLLRACPDEEDTIDQIVNLLVDTCSSKRRMLRVAGDDKPAEVVRSRFMKLNADHIRFMLKCLAESTAPVRNMKQYLLAALYHMRIGSAVQHICEFAERMARSHATVEPEPLTQQDYRVWNLEYDFYLTVQENNGLWEYALYQGDCSLLERGKLDAPELMVEEVRDEIVYTHNLGKNACISLSPEEFAQKLADREEIQSYRMKQFQQSGHDCYLVMQLHQDADPALRFASMRYLNKQNTAPSVENYEILYRGNLPDGKRSVPQAELLEQLYQKFNCAQPMDYHGHSLSVSDVILLNQAGKISAHYVDSIGFRELSGFQDRQERSSVMSQLKAKCDMPECNPTKCRKGRNDHAI